MSLPDVIFAVIGVGALVAALLPQLVDGKAFSLPIPFLLAGIAIGLLPFVPFEAVPRGNEKYVEHLTEVVVIVSLMGTGLGLDRKVGLRLWGNTWRLLVIAMPLTILFVGVLGWGLLGLAPAGAVLLGAVLAPTDPVLAGEVQVGEPAIEPTDENYAEDEVRFSLTSEAGLNDALAFPFVYMAITLAQIDIGTSGWFTEWFAFDVLYRLTVGLIAGVAAGWFLGRLFFSSKTNALRLAEHREGFVALAATFFTYGVTEILQGYGFLAVFVAAVTIRSFERFDGYHVILHSFIEQIERLLTVLVLLLVGMALADGILANIGWREVAVAAVILFAVRPITAGIALIGARGSRTERTAIAFFGVRGVGSIYYASYAFATTSFGDEDNVIYAIVGLVIAGSVILHGISAGPLMDKLDARRSASEEPSKAETA